MRVRDLSREEMDDAQRRVADEAISGKRGRMPGPLRVWIHSPELGQHAQRLGEFLRYSTSLGPRLSELAVLVTARVWTAHYEWFAHKRLALKGGMDPKIIEAIRDRRTPVFDDAQGKTIYTRTLNIFDTPDRYRFIQQSSPDGTTWTTTGSGISTRVGPR